MESHGSSHTKLESRVTESKPVIWVASLLSTFAEPLVRPPDVTSVYFYRWLHCRVKSPSPGPTQRYYSKGIDHSHERGVSLVRVSPLSDWYVFQQRRVHGHFARRTLIFRFRKVWAKKNGQLVWGTKAELVRCNLSYFIFPEWGAIPLDGLRKGEKKKLRLKRELDLEKFSEPCHDKPVNGVAQRAGGWWLVDGGTPLFRSARNRNFL